MTTRASPWPSHLTTDGIIRKRAALPRSYASLRRQCVSSTRAVRACRIGRSGGDPAIGYVSGKRRSSGDSCVVILDCRYASGLFLTCRKGQVQSFRPLQFKPQLHRHGTRRGLPARQDDDKGKREGRGRKVSEPILSKPWPQTSTLRRVSRYPQEESGSFTDFNPHGVRRRRITSGPHCA